jgi:hypothetical protein
MPSALLWDSMREKIEDSERHGTTDGEEADAGCEEDGRGIMN